MNNFNNLERSYKAYGGMACRKEGVIYNGEPYLLKYPANLRDKHLKGVNLSYANDTVCEHLGSTIFNLLGLPAQETLMGIASDKLVVLCKDFTVDGSTLIEFNKIKVSSSRDLKNPEQGDITHGDGTNLTNVLEVIRSSYFFEGLNAEEFFWKMFIIDYVIDNPDRNNGNWGIMLKDGKRMIAPVYDCGNCLQSKWDDAKCKEVLLDDKLLDEIIWKRKVCYFTDDADKRINPFKLIKSGDYPICTIALKQLLQCDFQSVFDFIQEFELISEIKREFYLKTIKGRIDLLFRALEGLNPMLL